MFDLASIERAFIDAAVDPSRWDYAMATVGAATRSPGALLIPWPPNSAPVVPMNEAMQPSFEAYIHGGWHERDLRFIGLKKLKRDGIVTDLDFVTTDEMRVLPYYREFLEPLGLRWFAGVKLSVGGHNWTLSIQRTIADGPFSGEEQAQLAGLSRSLASAGELISMLGFARMHAALDAYESCGTAAIMLDRHGQAIRLNAAAQRLLGSDLQVVRGRVTPANREAAAALDRVLHQLLWTASPAALAPPVVLPRREGAPLLAYPMRLESVSRDALAPCRAMLILRDLGERPRPPQEALRGAFRLTVAEARLAQRIAAGEALDRAADELGVAAQTARNQLKAVFSKTGVSRQADLVALMARFIAERQP